LLQELHRDGEEELTRYVAEIGGDYVQARERLGFRAAVAQIAPEVHNAREQANREHAAAVITEPGNYQGPPLPGRQRVADRSS